jgi:hypothetical protein
MIWKRITHYKYQRHVLKALFLLDYLIRLKPPSREFQLKIIDDILQPSQFQDLRLLAMMRERNGFPLVEAIRSQTCDLLEYLLFKKGRNAAYRGRLGAFDDDEIHRRSVGSMHSRSSSLMSIGADTHTPGVDSPSQQQQQQAKSHDFLGLDQARPPLLEKQSSMESRLFDFSAMKSLLDEESQRDPSFRASVEMRLSGIQDVDWSELEAKSDNQKAIKVGR